MGQIAIGVKTEREMACRSACRGININNPTGLLTLGATYELLQKVARISQWKHGQILLQDEEIAFQLLRGVNY